MLDDRLEDIALFFNLNGQPKKRWVSKEVYTDPTRQLQKLDPTWQMAVLAEGGKPTGPFYVTNLSKLLKPGVSPDPSAAKRVPLKGPVAQGPAQGDLVVIPYATPNVAYLVKQSDYLDTDICPDISEIEGADLKFLALTQGAVLANIPKEDLDGMTCYLLNLLGLNSGAIT
jgi:hypothetical protein